MGRGSRDPLINLTVRVKTGPFKGYVGIVKDATETTARVELHTGCKIITIDKTKVDPIAADGSNRPTSRPREPTPDQAPQTPHYGARTPAYDVTRTPMRDELLATPMHPGLATPSRDAWDPTMTPRHTPAWEAERYGETGTPGEYGNTPTPSGPSYYQYDRRTPSYTPATPSGYVESPAYPHAEPSPSPSPSPYAPFPQTPLPRTPHTPTAAAPATPAPFPTPMEEETRAPSSWLEKDIEVRVVKGDLFDKKGFIREVRDTLCRVFFPEKNETNEFSSESLEPVVPQKKDKVKIVRGDLKGQTGVLVGIDSKDGIVRMDSNFDIKIFQLSDLARFVQ
jgi:transcription elongation factor SPT5